jgi:hypothetical protein
LLKEFGLGLVLSWLLTMLYVQTFFEKAVHTNHGRSMVQLVRRTATS